MVTKKIKRGRGRPRMAEADKLTEKAEFFVQSAEKELLVAAAQAAGPDMSFSAWLRDVTVKAAKAALKRAPRP